MLVIFVVSVSFYVWIHEKITILNFTTITKIQKVHRGLFAFFTIFSGENRISYTLIKNLDFLFKWWPVWKSRSNHGNKKGSWVIWQVNELAPVAPSMNFNFFNFLTVERIPKWWYFRDQRVTLSTKPYEKSRLLNFLSRKFRKCKGDTRFSRFSAVNIKFV